MNKLFELLNSKNVLKKIYWIVNMDNFLNWYDSSKGSECMFVYISDLCTHLLPE